MKEKRPLSEAEVGLISERVGMCDVGEVMIIQFAPLSSVTFVAGDNLVTSEL